MGKGVYAAVDEGGRGDEVVPNDEPGARNLERTTQPVPTTFVRVVGALSIGPAQGSRNLYSRLTTVLTRAGISE